MMNQRAKIFQELLRSFIVQELYQESSTLSKVFNFIGYNEPVFNNQYFLLQLNGDVKFKLLAQTIDILYDRVEDPSSWVLRYNILQNLNNDGLYGDALQMAYATTWAGALAEIATNNVNCNITNEYISFVRDLFKTASTHEETINIFINYVLEYIVRFNYNSYDILKQEYLINKPIYLKMEIISQMLNNYNMSK